jgi:hypothetical protein
MKADGQDTKPLLPLEPSVRYTETGRSSSMVAQRCSSGQVSNLDLQFTGVGKAG